MTQRQTLYAQRVKEHLSHAKTLCASGDYVQAGEKIWGALSALVNTHSCRDVKRVEDKKICFISLFSTYNRVTPSLYPNMRALGFRNEEEVFDSIFGLHKFFYGGANYTSAQLSTMLPFFISLLENL